MKYLLDPAKYESAKRKFNQLLARKKLLWLPFRTESDIGVQVSRIYLKNQSVYLAFMRIKAKGFLTNKTTASDSKIIFHLIRGTAEFRYKGKQHNLTEGDYISVSPSSVYAIINHDPAQICYFVMQYVDMEKKMAKKRQKQLEHAAQRLTLNEAQAPQQAPQQQPPPQPQPTPQQPRRLSHRLAIKSAESAQKRERELAVHLETNQDIKLPLTRSVVARRMTRSQDATKACGSNSSKRVYIKRE